MGSNDCATLFLGGGASTVEFIRALAHGGRQRDTFDRADLGKPTSAKGQTGGGRPSRARGGIAFFHEQSLSQFGQSGIALFRRVGIGIVLV